MSSSEPDFEFPDLTPDPVPSLEEASKALEKAISQYVSARHQHAEADHDTTVDSAVLVWESMCYMGPGQPVARSVDYTTVGGQAGSVSAAIGLLTVGAKMIQDELLYSFVATEED